MQTEIPRPSIECTGSSPGTLEKYALIIMADTLVHDPASPVELFIAKAIISCTAARPSVKSGVRRARVD